MTRRWSAALVPVAVPMAVLAAACGAVPAAPVTGPPAPAVAPAHPAAPAPPGHDAADVMWLQMMVAHHGQGLEMAGLAGDRAASAELRTLADAVHVTQTDELATMTGWLTAWSEPAAVDAAPHVHADHGGLPATGPQEIAALTDASGRQFDAAFLPLFLAHQHSAVELTDLVTSDGGDPGVAALAGRIRDSRTDQVQLLLGLMAP